MSNFESELLLVQEAAKNSIVESRQKKLHNSLGNFLFLQYCNSKDRNAFCNKIKSSPIHTSQHMDLMRF